MTKSRDENIPRTKLPEKEELRRYVIQASTNSMESLRAMFDNKLRRCMEMGEARKVECRKSFEMHIEEMRDLNDSIIWWLDHSNGILKSIEFLEFVSKGGKLGSMLREAGVTEGEAREYWARYQDNARLVSMVKRAKSAWLVLSALCSAFTDKPDALAPSMDSANTRLFRLLSKGAFEESAVSIGEIMAVLHEKENTARTLYSERSALVQGISEHKELFESVVAEANRMRNSVYVTIPKSEDYGYKKA